LHPPRRDQLIEDLTMPIRFDQVAGSFFVRSLIPHRSEISRRISSSCGDPMSRSLAVALAGHDVHGGRIGGEGCCWRTDLAELKPSCGDPVRIDDGIDMSAPDLGG
jgi:hypothetical protein